MTRKGQVRISVPSVHQKQEVSKVRSPIIHRETAANHVLAEVLWVSVWQTNRQTDGKQTDRRRV